MSLKVPLVDLKAQYAELKPDIDFAIAGTVAETAFIGGSRVASFEKEFAEFCGVAHAVGASSGTTALHLALIGAGVGPGDEVVVPSHTFIASVEPILHCGAKPSFVDVRESTFNLDPLQVRRRITEKTKAILCVHLYGRCCDMEPILDIAREFGLSVVEDAAQAHGAGCSSGRAGSMGRTAAFSFYPGKNLGAFGDGGIVTTDDSKLAKRLRMLANHGREGKYEHELIGYNYRLDSLQAAVLSVKLKHLEEWNTKRLALARRYNDGFAGTSVVTPEAPEGHVFHLYVIRVPNRDELQAALGEQGIASGIHYPIPCHLQPCCRNLDTPTLPVTEKVVREIVSLPLFPELSLEEQDRIIDVVKEVSG